ncbi:MAG: nitroreductase family protein [Thermoleophilia bacterium]
MFIDLLRSRRSIRQFTDRAVEPEKIDLLVEAALRSPSSRGKNQWHFVVVTDPDKLAELATAKPSGSSLIGGAPLAIVVAGRPQDTDVWVEDTSIASLIIHLEAHDLGLGSCWVQLRLREHDETRSASEFVADVVGLGDEYLPEAIIAIGYPAAHKPGHPHTALMPDKVTYVRA